MKLQLEVTHVDARANSLTFKPINCDPNAINFRTLPNRAMEQFQLGQVVEATIPLPDHYPYLGDARMKELCDQPVDPYGSLGRLVGSKIRFKDLKPGDHFSMGGIGRYIKSQHVYTTDPKVDQFCGNVNTIDLKTGQVSGCGDEVEVVWLGASPTK
jgi:hypothetical protein